MIKTNQNCRIKRTYKKDCTEDKLCKPVYHFDQLEICKECDKIL